MTEGLQPFRKLMLRDLALLVLTVFGWALFAPISGGEGWLANFVGAGLGLAAGACAWVVHEWGHVLAALLARSKLRAATKLSSIYLFGFDNKTHTRGQFVAMALGGFVATALVFTGMILYLPPDLLATRTAQGVVMLEIALTVTLEVPGLLLGIFAYSKLPSVDVLGE